MIKKHKETLSDAVTCILQLKGLIASHEKQMEELKKTVTRLCATHPDAFNEDGQLELEGIGLIKIVQNTPVLTMDYNGKPMKDIEIVGLITLLGESFRKPAVYTTMIRDEVIKGNKDVLKALKKHKVTLGWGVRYDVKPLKEPVKSHVQQEDEKQRS